MENKLYGNVVDQLCEEDLQSLQVRGQAIEIISKTVFEEV